MLVHTLNVNVVSHSYSVLELASRLWFDCIRLHKIIFARVIDVRFDYSCQWKKSVKYTRQIVYNDHKGHNKYQRKSSGIPTSSTHGSLVPQRTLRATAARCFFLRRLRWTSKDPITFCGNSLLPLATLTCTAQRDQISCSAWARFSWWWCTLFSCWFRCQNLINWPFWLPKSQYQNLSATASGTLDKPHTTLT